MLINNKKFVISLVLFTMLAGLVFSGRHTKVASVAPITEKEVTDFSADFNKNLPLHITSDITLIKTQIGAINKSLYSLDFYYSYYQKHSDITNFDALTKSMIFQTCNNETTLSLLKRNVLLRHQFITLDKEKLPYIGVSIQDCQQIEKEKILAQEKSVQEKDKNLAKETITTLGKDK